MKFRKKILRFKDWKIWHEADIIFPKPGSKAEARLVDELTEELIEEINAGREK